MSFNYYSGGSGRGGFLSSLPPVTKNLIIINVIIFLASLINEDFMISTFALFYPTSPFFRWWQVVTHMFMHGGFWHIFFNMYTLLIFGCGLGIKGAGIATAISQFVSFVIMLSLCGRNGGIRIRFRHFRPSRQAYAEINAGGLPSLARQGLMSVAALCLNHTAAAYGDEAVAAFSVVSRIAMLACAAMIGYGQGFQPVCGFNYGAGLYDRVRAAFRHSLTVSTVYCTLLAVLGFIFAPGIVRVFRSDDAEVIRMGTEILRWQCLSFPLTGMVVMSNMYLQNIRKTVPAVLMATARQGLFFIPALFLGHWALGFLGIETAQTVSDACAFLLSLPLTIPTLRRMGAEG